MVFFCFSYPDGFSAFKILISYDMNKDDKGAKIKTARRAPSSDHKSNHIQFIPSRMTKNDKMTLTIVLKIMYFFSYLSALKNNIH